MRDFSKDHVLITGGGTGIGLAIARAFDSVGANLTLTGRNEERVKKAASTLKNAKGVGMDVTDPHSVTAGLEKASANFGPVTILINNAGAAESAPLNKTDAALWKRMLDTNLTGVFNLTATVMPEMKASGFGRVINVASTAGLEGYPYTSAYCAAKHGVVGFTRAVAKEVKGDVTINAVCPGFTRTEMVDRAIENIIAKTGMDQRAAEAEIAKMNAGGRLVEPEDVAEAVLSLAGGDENGQIIPLTGEDHDADGRDALRLWLQLLTLTTVMEKKIRRNFQAEHDTTLPRFDVLATLERNEKPMTMGELTEKLLVSKGNVTGVVASLVDQGLVKRVRDEEDRRTHFLSLTKKGKSAFQNQAKAHQGWVGDFFSGLDDKDLALMVDHLAALKEAVTRNGKGARS